MSNFRRLISYIYAYEGGVKGKNIGFAKLDIRGDQCRIQVNVKMVYVGSNDIGVYLLSPKVELLLGRIFIRNGSGEFRININSSNIEGSGLRMEDCYGLTVHDVESTWQCYTTIWDDEMTQAADTATSMTLETVTAGSTVEITAEATTETEPETNAELESPEPLELPISAEIEKELEREELELQATAPWDSEPEEEMEKNELEEKNGQMISTEQIPETEPECEQNAVLPEEETIPEEQVVPEPEPACGPEDCEKLKELDRLEEEEKNKNRLWDHLQKRYAKVLAFDYDKGCEILSIKPQDIGLLPRDIWVYGNNSFLLHGFYNYRHLILAKLNEPEGTPRYLLGVPGHYFSNEKYLASMFGFPHFVLARKQPDEDGRFGYWYTDIRL